jgi:DNA-3-methyladenine glycosylase I
MESSADQPADPPSAPLIRCAWAKSPLMTRYHDEEWGVPIYDDRQLFEFLILEGAQAGLSWETVLKKRAHYRAAFDHFNAARIAAYDQRKIDELLANEQIIRNRLKIAAAIQNARAFLAIRAEYGSFASYIWQFVGGQPHINTWHTLAQIPTRTPESDAMSKALKKRGFAFVGSTICYAFMQATGMINDHLVDCFRYPLVHTDAHQP